MRVVDHLPGTKDSPGTNFCDITARVVRGRVLTISCLDNLIKGASGAAVQNFNLMYGFPETTALAVALGESPTSVRVGTLQSRAAAWPTDLALSEKNACMSISVPKGFLMAGVHCGSSAIRTSTT